MFLDGKLCLEYIISSSDCVNLEKSVWKDQMSGAIQKRKDAATREHDPETLKSSPAHRLLKKDCGKVKNSLAI